MVQDQAFGKYYSSPPETVGNIFNDKLEYNPGDCFLLGRLDCVCFLDYHRCKGWYSRFKVKYLDRAMCIFEL